MTTFVFLFRELLGAIRPRSATYLLLACLLILVFLGSFASLFLFVSPVADAIVRDPGEIRIWLSPRLSTSAIDTLYYSLQGRSEVESLRFQFAQEVEQGETGGLFVASLRSGTSVDAFVTAIESTDGVTRVEAQSDKNDSHPVSLAASIRIALLLGLALSAGLSLITGRLGFRRLMEDFAGEIRLLRLSGIAQQTISPPIVALGLLLGILSGLLIATGISLLHFTLSAGPRSQPMGCSTAAAWPASSSSISSSERSWEASSASSAPASSVDESSLPCPSLPKSRSRLPYSHGLCTAGFLVERGSRALRRPRGIRQT